MAMVHGTRAKSQIDYVVFENQARMVLLELTSPDLWNTGEMSPSRATRPQSFARAPASKCDHK